LLLRILMIGVAFTWLYNRTGGRALYPKNCTSRYCVI
jgi:hypothetical protein